jgi:hypothetical protein
MIKLFKKQVSQYTGGPYTSNPACSHRQYNMQIDREVHMLI